MSRQDQLEAVARDWCMTIRASQIIPVYPLTEDVQPGDIFLVQTTIDKQQEVYKKRGFLPLDNHIARLDPTGYGSFYDRSFLPKASVDPRLPAAWIRPAGEDAYWADAPNAAFPSYAFSVEKGAGLSLAVPISAVSIGLSLLGTTSANGSISIERAHTMGVDMVSLFADLQRWALRNRGFIRSFAPQDGDRASNYLRVITRVYATGQVDVALSDSRSLAAGVDVGVARPVDLISGRAPTSLEDTRQASIDNYTRSLAAMNAMLAESRRPTRASGSNAGLSPEEIRAKTQATREAEQQTREELQTRLHETRGVQAETTQSTVAARDAFDVARVDAEAAHATLDVARRDSAEAE